ncbi:(2Fe-2S)-binding protein [Lutimonas zeaxanthinifaciens]|uniref:(2Fe-2S)-binding protein n=1 Tax=Lutimonas zeaxanthinifaciens TaxID=3060215 RepID=UPI00265C9EDE|nr:(2Fe-2S)-binding protein [Lutimonas sp. YSD2104]WKK64640.1 (2Fe-2S)-binding protein [Lutimonas sp. YSD2104]
MINITVNGEQYTLDVSPEMPALWVLRDVLQLTGTKYGCGMGVCGSCSILVEGKAVRSCVTPISNFNNKEIISIEGIYKVNKTVQKAWEELNVPQCGFCQPGQVISAVALLQEKPSPSNEDIDKGMSGNICRCGTYLRIRKAIHLAASKMNESENDDAL